MAYHHYIIYYVKNIGTNSRENLGLV